MKFLLFPSIVLQIHNRRVASLVYALLPLIGLLSPNRHIAQDIIGPPGSGTFGNSTTVLPNGFLVITDAGYDIPAGAANVGAVYLYNGTTQISMLTGTTADDQVGNGGVIVLSNGNYVVVSPGWDNGAATNAGAVTWGDGSTGISGGVSSTNSLVGSTANDQVGGSGITALSSGNYVVRSDNWDNGAVVNAGAVTWGNGSTGISGVVSSINSLVGSTAADQVGSTGLTALSNGNYVVRSKNWDSGAIADVGAVTWGNGSTGISGEVNSTNSLVGSTASDQVGGSGITALSSGNYVVLSDNWDNGAIVGAGAVTWGNGSTGISGEVSSTNSLVGSKASDQVGSSGLTALTNGNYVVASRNWDNGAIANAGAVTWGNGNTGVSGVVSSTNSLVGSTVSDQVGIDGATALSNGNYVVRSRIWNNGAIADAGAVTWGNGSTGISGEVSSTNSLVGSTAFDAVGSPGVTVLTNGNYVVRSFSWDNGAIADAGAVTWGDGSTGITGEVSSTNSLVGSTVNDRVGNAGVTVLTNGNYVVRSSSWDNGAIADAGAVTWGDGGIGISGVVSSANSLVGSTASDAVGSFDVAALSNGNYVVVSPNWDNGAIVGVGAVTWGDGSTGISGVVSSTNSLVGSTASDQVGSAGVTVLTNGNYVVRSSVWDNGAIADAGAVTWGNGSTGISGEVSSTNSLAGSTVNDGVGSTGLTALPNGNYVVRSNNWDNGAIAGAGAVTWGNGSTGISGEVSSTNSLVGSTANDQVGSTGLTILSNGNYAVLSSAWDNGAIANAEAVTLGDANGGTTGAITAGNSVLGTVSNGIDGFRFNAVTNLVVVMRSPSNIITLFDPALTFPVEWLSFDATPAGDAVLLDWATASEQNNAFFTVERSLNGVDFEDIGIVAAVGNSSSTVAYNLTDLSPFAETGGGVILHYRVRQTDIDGHSSHSTIRTVSLDRDSGLAAWPNPATDQLMVRVPAGNALVVLSDGAGRVVHTVALDGQAAAIEVDLSEFAAGVYTLRAGTVVLRVVKE